jgi:hypothetical protein
MSGLFSRLAQRAVASQSVPRPSQRSFGSEVQSSPELVDLASVPVESVVPMRVPTVAQSDRAPLQQPMTRARPPVTGVAARPAESSQPQVMDAPTAQTIELEPMRPAREPAPKSPTQRVEMEKVVVAPLRSPAIVRAIEQHLPPARSRDPSPEPTAEPTVVNVTIDRVEVKMPAPERQVSVAPRPATSQRVSLEDYLAGSARR